MPEGHDVIRAGAELVLAKTNRWITPGDLQAGVVILIHGFTSHGRYMKGLADFIDGHGFCCALFNYDSFLGVDAAADDLASRLDPIREPLQKNGFTLLAHSMGGLVARLLARNLDPALREALKGVALLGTPNQGALSAGQALVSYMLDWADWLTVANPYARSSLCRSSQQLTLADPEQLIPTLNRADSESPLALPYLSISGGRSYLELGKRPGWLRNHLLQTVIGESPNDGLVAEHSADFTRISSTNAQHIGAATEIQPMGYPEFPRINHTYLTRSQAVAGIVLRWLLSTAKLNARLPVVEIQE